MHVYRLSPILSLLAPVLAFAQQVVVIDDAHLQMQQAGKPPASMYEVKPAPALVLDATKYEFKVPPQLAGKPINSVQVIAGKDRQYSAPWNSQKGMQLLSSETMKPNPGSLPFTGFAIDQQLVLAIGNLDGSKFNVVWVGMAKVK